MNCIKSLALSFWRNAERLTGIATIIGLLAGGCFGLWQYRENSQNQKKDMTIQYLTGFSNMLENTDPVLLDTINFFKNKSLDSLVYNKYGEIHEEILEKLLHDNKKWRQQIDNIMIYLNQFAIGCQEGFYDEHTAWYSNHYRIINAYNALYPYIEIRRREENFDVDNKPCGFLRAMTYRWRKNLGECEKWDKEDAEKIRKNKEEIEKLREKKEKT